MEQKITLIQSSDIEIALSKTSRQYLVGQLARPQLLEHIDDGHVEIGISSYDDFTTEIPHYHTQAHEYGYMISGLTEYLDLETGIEYHFEKGDFFKIPPGVKYAQKSKAGTQLLFIKTPPGNDKHCLEVTSTVDEWLNTKI